MLAIPLTPEQIASAIKLQALMPVWSDTNQALHELATRFPCFDPPSSLLKAAVLNQLYGTNVYAIPRMAQHISRIMTANRVQNPDIDLVEAIAALPKTEAQQYERRHTSFASKFAHFFVDTERFPIYDLYADRMVRYHLRKRDTSNNIARPYRAFVENVQRLRAAAGLTCTISELDCYLWLAGLYRVWRKQADAPINKEARQLFMESTHTQELACLLGER